MTDGKYSVLEKCRVCGSTNLAEYLDLGEMPLANNLVTEETIAQEEKFPLKVLFCRDCFFSQLGIVVNPDIMFRNYVYRSSISEHFRRHCEELARELNGGVLEEGDLVVDIASNDGCLLREFKAKGNRVLGVDPAINLAKIANAQGIETIPDYWSPGLAKELAEKHGKAKAIIAINVFAHINDLHSMVEGVKEMLDDGGYFIIESPHLASLIEHTEFDTIYHEHLSYLLVKPLAGLMKGHGMRIAKVKKTSIHGGSIRLYVEKESKQDSGDGSTQEIISEEENAGLHSLARYEKFSEDVNAVKEGMEKILNEAKEQGKKVCAYGASAKGNTLLNYCRINADLVECIFDDTPEKQGKLYPGVHIPIVAGKELGERNPDYLVLLAWNFAQELMEKTKAFKEKGGKYIIPIPRVKIVE